MSKSAVFKYLSSIGKKGGSATSVAKTVAARANAKLPRKRGRKGKE